MKQGTQTNSFVFLASVLDPQYSKHCILSRILLTGYPKSLQYVCSSPLYIGKEYILTSQ